MRINRTRTVAILACLTGVVWVLPVSYRNEADAPVQAMAEERASLLDPVSPVDSSVAASVHDVKHLLPALLVSQRRPLLVSQAQLPPSPSPAADAADSTPPAPHPSLSTNRYVGVGSCAAAGCHGADGTRGVTGSEYSIWIQDDPHSRAYSVLHNPLSQQIARKLDLKVEAHDAKACLACHSEYQAQDNLADNARFTLADGVGCESCHGPAQVWLEPHKRLNWQTMPAASKSAQGFWNTDDLLTRTRICASCHVGSPGRDVNHELIAAGHPPLKFEMASYHQRMPRHWSLKKDRERHAPSLHAKLWAVGQAASAEMSMRLLHRRASTPEAVWPEFSEYGCFACHHDLQPASWRQQRGYAGRRPGDLVWGSWSTPLLPALARATGDVDVNQLTNTLGQLSSQLGRPYGQNTKPVAVNASVAADLLAGWAEALNQRQFTAGEIGSLQSTLAGEGEAVSGQSWDAAVQVYVGLVALERARLETAGDNAPPDHAAVLQQLKAIRDGLAFPPAEEGVQYNSPQTFGPDKTKIVQDALEKLRTIVGKD